MVFHLGSNPPERALSLLALVPQALRHAHVWITCFEVSQLESPLTSAAELRLPIHPVVVRNKGLDVGPFLLVLAHIHSCGYQYEYILKFHLKSREGPMQRLAHSLFTKGLLPRGLEVLGSQPGVSVVYPQSAEYNLVCSALASCADLALAPIHGSVSPFVPRRLRFALLVPHISAVCGGRLPSCPSSCI